MSITAVEASAISETEHIPELEAMVFYASCFMQCNFVEMSGLIIIMGDWIQATNNIST